jgi:hypothetical protein
MNQTRGQNERADAAHSEQVEATIERLYEEIRAADGDPQVRLAPDQPLESVRNRVVDGLFDGERFDFDESMTKENLDEILLLLIAARESDRHGKALIGDLTAVFDAHLSPGTVYPQLHQLEDEGLLQMHEKVRTKEYHVGDDEGVRARLERSMHQHLALGYAIYLALEDA